MGRRAGRHGPAHVLTVTAGSSLLDDLLSRFPVLASRLPGLERAARTDAPVLILGEPGSGRTTLCRALHRSSRRAPGPLVEVDAAGIPATLFESELFGHQAGAFTGAGAAQPGRVARAEGGTLLLDHVDQLPLAVQPKLLRLVAERRFTPLGGDERDADVRFAAVAEEDLPERVEEGRFRADLYYRLQVLAFRVPPLRERRDELVEVAEALLEDLATRQGRSGVRLSERARGWIPEQPWPGNLTQLRGVLERALILEPGEVIDPSPPGPDLGEVRPASLPEMEAEHIRRVLAYTRGHQGQAAEILGLSRKGLWEKRKRYGIP